MMQQFCLGIVEGYMTQEGPNGCCKISHKVKNPILEKSPINISCATSNSAFEGLWFCCFYNYTYIYQSNCFYR